MIPQYFIVWRSKGSILSHDTRSGRLHPKLVARLLDLIDNNGREAVKCAQTDSNQAEAVCPTRFFAPSEPAKHRINLAGKKKGRTMNPLTQSNNTTILPVLIALTLGCVALSPTGLAVTPAPDGGYPNGNTAEGQDALFSLTTGFSNTASGFDALYSNTSGDDNTATGAY
jgi:hypothetical protein